MYVAGVSPDGEAVVTTPFLGRGKRFEAEVHQGSARTRRIEVSGVPGVQPADPPPGLLRNLRSPAERPVWSQIGDRWTITGWCDGCTTRVLPD